MSLKRLLESREDGHDDPIDAILAVRRHAIGCKRGSNTQQADEQCTTCAATEYYNKVGAEVDELVEENNRMRLALLGKEKHLDSLHKESTEKDNSLYRWRMAVAVLALIAIELRCPGTCTSGSEY